MKSKTLLYSELFLLIILFYLADFGGIFNNLILTVIFIFGAAAAIWSLLTLELRYFSPFPEPPKKHKLAKSGLYGYVRHPMYTGIMLIGISLVFSNPTFQIFLIYFALVYILDTKASLEEELLSKIYPEYKNYNQKTKKFVPYFY